MNIKDNRFICKLARIGIKTKKHRVYKKQIKRINPLLKANGRVELTINSKKKK